MAERREEHNNADAAGSESASVVPPRVETARSRHVARALRGVRALHRDMSDETCPRRLTERICETLTQALGYRHVWIALLDGEDGGVAHLTHSGLDEAGATLDSFFRSGMQPLCMTEALRKPGEVVIHEPATECESCPLHNVQPYHIGLCRTLSWQGHTYGVMTVSLPAHLIDSPDERILFAELADDIGAGLHQRDASARRAEELIAALHAGASGVTGETFFARLVAELGKLMGVDYALVLKLADRDCAHTLAIWHAGEILENMSYPLQGTPCMEVHQCAETRVIREGVAARFSGDERLMQMDIEGFMGTPLCDASGNVLGILAVLHRAPLKEVDTMRQVMEVFAARAGGELERLASEVTLRETRERMALALEGALLGTWDWHVPSGRVVVDDRWGQMVGLGPDEIPSDIAACLQLIHPDDITPVSEAFSAHLEGRCPDYLSEHRLRTRDGNYIWVLDRGRIISWDAKGNPARMCGTHQDITDRKEAERALAEAKQRMELALEGAALGTWDWHVPSGHVVFNARWAEMLGYRLEELAPHVSTWERLMHPDDASFVMDAVKDHLEGRTARYDVEHRLQHRDGHYVWVQDSGKVVARDDAGNAVRMCGTHLDINPRKMAEKEQATAHALLSGVIEQSRVPTAISSPDGTLTFNRSCKELLEPQALSGGLCQGIHLDSIARTWRLYDKVGRKIASDQAPLRRALAGEQICNEEMRLVRADGSERWVMAQAGPVYGLDGELLAGVVSFPDITDYKRAENILGTFFDLPLHLHMILDNHGVIQRVNTGWKESLGYDREDMEGHVFLDFVHPEDHRKTQEIAAFIAEGNEVLHFENRYLHKDGGFRLLTWASRYLDEHKTLYGVAEDITQKRAAEDALRESELRYRQMFQNNLAIKLMIDPEDGRILEASEGAARFYGYDIATLTQMRISDINTLSEEEVAQEMVLAKRQDRLYFNFKHRLASGDICEVEVYSGPVVVGGKKVLFSIIHDVSERVRAQRELARSERRYRHLLETAGEGFWLINTKRLTTEVNPAMCEMLGYTAKEMIGRSPLDFADEKNQAIFRHQFKRFADTEHRSYEITLCRKDGAPISCRFNATTLFDVSGVVTGAFALVTDVSAMKRAEAALRESEHKLRSIFRAAPIGLAVLKGRTLQAVNQEWERITGYGRTELIGRESRVLYLTQEEFDRVGDVLLSAMESRGVGTTETRIRRKTGEIIDVMVSSTPVDADDQGAGYTACVMDITERHRQEEALRASEADLKHAQAIAKVGSYRWNMVTGNIVWSDQLYENFGVAGVQPTLDLMMSLLHPEDRERVQAVGEMSRKTGEPFDVEYRIVRPDGHVRHVRDVGKISFDEAGNPISMFGTSQDITERKEAEKERDRLIRAIEQAAESVVITDVDGSILYVNPAFERTTGYTREEAVGQNPRILKSGETDPAVYRELWDTLVRGETWSGHLKNRRKDGRVFTEEAVISPVQDDTGKTVNYVAVKRDITDEIQLETQYRQAQKMEAIGQLTGGVAHDFNNLLQVMNMGTELARDELPEDHPALEPLHQVSEAGARAARLVSQLLLFSRRQVMQPEILDLNATISDLMKMLSRVITENIHLTWSPTPAPAIINADRGMVEQALVNLAVNARDAMPQGGTLSITTHLVTLLESNVLTRGAGRPGTFVVVEIRDTGHGMDEELLSRIFEPFFTTKEVGKGTGLGLATVYGILEQHKGWVHAASLPGEGTIFELYWPAHTAAAKEDSTEHSPEVRGGRETILLAEDDPLVRTLGGTILTRAGYTVLMAEDGASAVEVFTAHADEIGLVVLDLMMPIMDGREAYDQIRALSPDARVLFASGYSEDTVSRDFVLEAGLNLIQKPFTREEFLGTVRKLLDA